MPIHHAQIKSAESMGYTLEEKEGGLVRAFMASTGQQIFGVSAKDAMNQMIAFQNILKRDPDLRFVAADSTPTIGSLRRTDNDVVSHNEPTTPVKLYQMFGELEWAVPSSSETVDNIEDTFETEKSEVDDTPMIKRSEKGVAHDGAVAYKEGVMAADNPFEEGTDEADQWDSQWDQAADDSPEQGDEAKGGSVVSSRYRTKYTEEGHPTHCGDWLATLLNNFCIGDKHTDLAVFEQICGLNGVNLDKYNRTTPGWQGRLRMTGRNLLSRKVFDNKHINVPNAEVEGGAQQIVAPADWLAAQRFNKPNAAE